MRCIRITRKNTQKFIFGLYTLYTRVRYVCEAIDTQTETNAYDYE